MKNFLIVFPCDTLAYSPTMLNMADMLAQHGEVEVITLWDGRGEAAAKSLPARFFYVFIPSLLRRILQRFFNKFYCRVKAFLLLRSLRKHKGNYDVVFAVDSLGYVVARKVYSKRVVYVSLEIYDDIWLTFTKKIGVDLLLIQSKERKEFLFGDAPTPYRILPNSNRRFSEPASAALRPRGARLVYMGAVYPVHGVEFCIEALTALPEQFSLTLKGVLSKRYKGVLLKKYASLLRAGRLRIDDAYTPQEGVVDYLSAFDAGLCFYDVEGALAGDFNYVSCPSGKMYSYFAAGLPMVGQKILGLQDVLSYDAGILVDHPTPQEIARAVEEVFSDHERFREGALRAGKDLCFEPHFNAILSELLSS